MRSGFPRWKLLYSVEHIWSLGLLEQDGVVRENGIPLRRRKMRYLSDMEYE
jgi:hypothetical protein